MRRKVHDRLQDILKQVKDGTIKAPERDEKPIEWGSYTEAQLNEIKDYVLLTKALVDEVAAKLHHILAPPGKEGRPAKPATDKAKAVLIQQYFQSSNRVTAGLLWFVKDRLGITTELTYQDIARAYSDPDVLLILKTVFDLTIEPIRSVEHNLSIDGTGEPTSIKQNYEQDKGGPKAARYDMLICMIGTETKMFTAFDVTGPGGEAPFLEPLLEESAEKLDRIDGVEADAAYLSQKTCRAIAACGAVPRIFPKEGITLHAKGSAAWRRMLTEFVEHTQEWLAEYHRRSISETGNSVLKRVYHRPLLKRLDSRRGAEVGYRVVSYNIRRLVYLFYQGLPVPWLR